MESYTSWTKWLRNMLAVLYYKSNQKDFKVHKTIKRPYKTKNFFWIKSKLALPNVK